MRLGNLHTLVIAITVAATAAALPAHAQDPYPDDSYPNDPFSDEYEVPETTEVGTAAGQIRAMGLLGIADREGLGVDLQATIEKMTSAYMGVRFSTDLSVWSQEDNSPAVWSFSLGPGFHFLPYRPVDLGLFVEGGIALIDPVGGPVSPFVQPGVTVDIALSTYWYLHFEGQVVWTVYELNDHVETAPWYRGLFGLGFGL